MTDNADNVAATLASLGLTVVATFVPFSASRNAMEAKTNSDLSLNWRVAVLHNDRPVIETDYQQGIGHAPAYKASVRALGHANSVMRFEALQYEAENGRESRRHDTFGTGGKRLNPPSAADVVYSLASDASAIDCATFEDWADELGYDADSRKAESIYRACLETGLRLRSALGDAGLEQLRAAFQDY